MAGGSRPKRALTASVTPLGAAGTGGGTGVATAGAGAGGAGLIGAAGNSEVGGPTLLPGGFATGGALGMSAGGRGGASPEDCANA